MIIRSADFVTSAVKTSQYPPADRPEIAFAGRSNVGKSTLINRLLNRRQLVKTSSTPGRTQLINFFDINGAFHFVDLPGYGYARVPQAVSKNWGPMVETYLSHRTTLKAVVLIVDIRRTPGAEEINFMAWLKDLSLTCFPVVTKADKLSKTKQARQVDIIARTLAVDKTGLITFSAKSGQGKEAVWQTLRQIMQLST